MTQTTYNAKQLTVLKGLEAVRMRPGMYIGSTEYRGLHHMLWEIVDNAVDEAANGYADTICVTLHKDDSVTVEDNGRGIPVDMHPELQVSGVEVVYTQLHAGGKFYSDNYEYSGGLHGVGASVVNALSRKLVVEVARNGILYRQEFQSVEDENTGKILPGRSTNPLEELGRTRRKGSKVTFWPDDRVFETTDFNLETVSRRLRELAFLNKGVTIYLTDEREKEPTKLEFLYNGGILDYVQYINRDKTVLFETPILMEGRSNDIIIEIAIQFNDGYSEGIFSYVNNIATPEGGMHETGFKAAFTKCMNDYARKTGILKEKDANLTGDDYREGMTALLSIKMKDAQFEGQTKTRLGNTEARNAVDTVVSEQLTLFLEDLRNQNVVKAIFDKSLKAAKAREAARKAKAMTREKSKLEGAPLVGKLASCTGRNPKENELFIVEGDSAGGSAKQGRDRRFQAILPLRGKPLNSEKRRLEQVIANEEFRTIITALGASIGDDFNLENLKYDRIIILADADQDGAHIRAILLTFFYRYMKELILNGHVYIGMPPLYKIKRGKKEYYAYDDAELEKLQQEGKQDYSVQRYKGLGEMNPPQLWDTTLNPETRSLIRVRIDDAAAAEDIVTVLMGSRVESRKEYIQQHANFNTDDIFLDMGGQ